MPGKDPTNWGWAIWVLAMGMSVAGGLVNWYRRVRAGHTRAFNLVELVGEIFTSGFVGLAVFMALQAFDQPLGICATAAGIGGHMATRLLFWVERLIESWLESRVRSEKR